MLALSLSVLILLAMATPPARPVVTDMKTKTGDTDALPVTTVVTTSVPNEILPEATKQQSIVKLFQGFVGIKEEPLGSNNGPMVDKFNASCGLSRADHAPWCASVAHYGYVANGLPGKGAYSPSWFSKTRRVTQTDVLPADIGLIYFPSKGRYAHTIAAIEKPVRSAGRIVQVTTLEGNTNAQGSREGDQFARRTRPADTITFMRWWK